MYARTETSWSRQAKLVPTDGAAGDSFGFPVAVDGDTVVVGARLDDDNGTDSGSAYVFTRVGTVWGSNAKLTAADGAANDWLGYAVAVDANTVLVGAHRDDDKGTDSGSAWVLPVTR